MNVLRSSFVLFIFLCIITGIIYHYLLLFYQVLSLITKQKAHLSKRIILSSVQHSLANLSRRLNTFMAAHQQPLAHLIMGSLIVAVIWRLIMPYRQNVCYSHSKLKFSIIKTTWPYLSIRSALQPVD